MANWIKCTSKDGSELRLNLEHVALIRAHQKDRGFTGSEVVFASGLSSIIVNEGQEYLTGPPSIERGHDQV
jgi:hypothetical protein